MRLRLGNFASDECVYALGNRFFKQVLCTPCAPSDAPKRTVWVGHNRYRRFAKPAVQQLRQSRRIFNRYLRLTDKAQTLLTESTVYAKPHMIGQLGVVTQRGVGVQWQVIGQQIDFVLQQQRQTCFKPPRHRTRLVAPKQTMVNQQSVGTGVNGRLDQCQTGSNA